MQCTKCGNLIPDGNRFCTLCGTECVEQNNVERPSPTASTDDKRDENLPNEEKTCPHCGGVVYDGEIYCVSCGKKATNKQADKLAETLQDSLSKMINANAVFSFISRFRWLFVLAYPLYALTYAFEATNGLYNIINPFAVLLLCAFNLSILCSYAKADVLCGGTGLALRAISCLVIMITATDFSWGNLFRILLIGLAAIYIYNHLLTQSQRQNLLDTAKQVTNPNNK